MNFTTIFIILLVCALIGTLPTWEYNHTWGYGPAALVGVVLTLTVIMALLGKI